jgi:hypothetical protein
MSFLLIYIGEGQRFDVDAVTAALRNIPGVDRIKVTDVFKGLIEATCDTGSDSVIVRVTEDAESISLSNDGDAALKVALDLQARMATPLHMIDEGYTFDVSLIAYSSPEDLKRAIQIGSTS